MTGLELPIALFLLVNLVVALIAAARGPTAADRMLMALLFGSTGTGILVLLAYAGGGTLAGLTLAGLTLAGLTLADLALVDVALVLALLAAIGGIAFARRAWQGGQDA